MRATVALVKEEKDAKSYTARFYGQKRPIIGAYQFHSWTPEKHSYSAPSSYVMPKYSDGVFAVLYSYGARSGPSEGHANNTGGSPGYCEVIITLK